MMTKIRTVLVDLNHPAHFHLLKNLIWILKRSGYKVVITSRKKDILSKLLDDHEWNHIVLSQAGKGFYSLVHELVYRDIRVVQLAQEHSVDFFIGSSVAVAHAGWLMRKPSVVFAEDDMKVTPTFFKLTCPFANYVVTPECFIGTISRKKHTRHRSYHELAYLHPNNFQPNEKVLMKYKLTKRKYIIVRFSALKAHHDNNAEGISKDCWNQLKSILNEYRIIQSVEGNSSDEIEPSDMHHVMAFARMVISDSQTMSAEAAVLGIPSFRLNSFAGRISYLEELQNSYQLTMGFKPHQDREFIRAIIENLNNDESIKLSRQNREAMLIQKVDLNDWMIQFFSNLGFNFNHIHLKTPSVLTKENIEI